MKKEKYSFGESDTEWVDGKKVPVSIHPKYEATKQNVVKLLESEKYKDTLTPGDFWILKNFNKEKTKCTYTGLIISHEALVKINDMLPENERFNQQFCSDLIPTNWKDTEGYRLEYRDKRDGMFEIGEISTSNCSNQYPYAMVLKRVFDRVVKRKAKLSMVYSDSEADEFKEPVVEKEEPRITEEQFNQIINFKDVILDELMQREINSPSQLSKISVVEASKLCKMIEDRLDGKEDVPGAA